MLFQWTYCVRIWVAWLGLSPLLLNIPFAEFGWTAYVACFGPLTLLAFGHRGASVVVWLGLAAIVGHWLFELTQNGLSSQVVVECLIFVFGIAFGQQALMESVEPEAVRATESSNKDDDAEAMLAYIVHRELGRARRHGKSFALISADVLPDRINSPLGKSDVLQGLCNALSNRLHVYADTMIVDERVLALVPEVDGADRPGLERRLRYGIREEMGAEVRMGIAFYPLNGITVEDLIECADRHRVGHTAMGVQANSLGNEEVAT